MGALMKYFVGAFLVVVLITGYFLNKSNKEDAERLRRAEVAHQQKLEREKVDEAKAIQLSAQRQAEEAKTKALKLEKEKQDQNKRIQTNENEKLKAKEKNEKELQDFQVIFNKWMTQDSIASSTARVAVAAPVTELRKIRDELNSLEIKGCLVNSKSQLMSAMNDEILMFVYFMQNNASSIKKVEELKISYFNKLADAIESDTACRK